MDDEKQWHINAKDEVRPCKATMRACRYAETSPHFQTENEATLYVVARYAETNGGGLKGIQKPVETKVIKPLSERIEEMRAPIHIGAYSSESIKKKRRWFNNQKTHLIVGGEEYPILRNRKKSAFLCKNCGEQLTIKQEEALLSYDPADACSCGTRPSSVEKQPLGVFEDSMWVLEPHRHATKKLYHATYRDGWAVGVKEDGDFRIHLGNERATNDRIRDYTLENMGADNIRGKKPKRFTVKLQKPPEIKVLLAEDLVDSWDRVSDDGEYVAYMNRWEAPGDLSVMVSSKYVTIEENAYTYTQAW